MINSFLVTKIKLVIYLPLTILAAASGTFLYFASTPQIVVVNFLIYFLILFTSKILLNSFIQKMILMTMTVHKELEDITYSSNLLKNEISEIKNWDIYLSEMELQLSRNKVKHEELEEVYQKLKSHLLILMKVENRKDQIASTKELGNICVDLKKLEKEFEFIFSDYQTKTSALRESLAEDKNSETVLLISENIHSKLERLDSRFTDTGIIRRTRSSQNETIPFRSGILRKAIRLAEKKAA